MGKTIVRLTIPFTFAAEGKYQVSIGGKIANIEITYVLNDDALNKIMEIETMGKRQLMPDDPEGTVNISRVTIEFLFEISNADLMGEGPEKLDKVRQQSLIYLNRLREVIRYHTNQYWLRSISPRHLNIYEIVRYNDEGRGRRLMMLAPPPGNPFPTSVKEFTEVQSEISTTLLNEAQIPLSDRLYQDAFLFLSFSFFFHLYKTVETMMLE